MRDPQTDGTRTADPCPTLLIERGPHDEGVGDWVPLEKHRLLRQYLDASRHAWKRWPNRVFIDPFAGPGRIQVKGESTSRDGGSVVAWRALEKHTPFTHMFIGDISEERATACEKRLKAIGAPATSFIGPAVSTVEKMVAAVPKGSLCFAYVDPYNLALLDFAMLQKLASLRNVDLAVNFSTMDLKRNADHELDPERARFDAAAPGWRDTPFARTANTQTLHVELFKYWLGLVQSLDFKFSREMPLITNDMGREIYRMSFFARHALPIKLWNDVAKGRNRTFDFD
jgi:three-Cys-motif partner protein